MRTTYNGAYEATFTSLPFGDGQTTASGTDGDAYHFALLDSDSETTTDHAQFRQYSSTQGRWMRPDPYSGSYDFSNPQSFNRYAYVLNNPLSLVDPYGLTDCPDNSGCTYDNGEDEYFEQYYDYGGDFSGAQDNANSNTPAWVTQVFQQLDVDTGDCYLSSYSCQLQLNMLSVSATGFFGFRSGGAGAPNKPTVIPNPCPYQGRALPPSGYAMAGKQANGSSVNFALDVTMGFPAGHYLDPQPLASGNVYQNQAYGNYTFGVFMASAGVSLSTALSGANVYAFFRASYPSWTQMDSKYSSIPAASVANITNGYNAQTNGTTCHN